LQGWYESEADYQMGIKSDWKFYLTLSPDW